MRSLYFFAIAAPIIASAQQVHLVVVGDSSGATKFTPEAIAANAGDIVTFQFQQKNHSVVQTSLAAPCSPKEGGFTSGFMPVAPDVTSDFPEYNITVQDTQPIWVFCGQTNPVSHCGKGMVFAVNCGADGAPNSFTNFQAAAMATASGSAPSSPYGAPPPASSPSDPSSGSPPTSSSGSSPVLSPAPSDPNAPTGSTSTGSGTVINVSVGENATLTFNPPRVTANPGDTLVFTFMSKNHTITQSTFAQPCLKMNNATANLVGFDSGFMFVEPDSSQFLTYSVQVNDTKPIWAYCKQRTPSPHCGQGMVFAVNTDESSDKSYAAFVALAKQQNGTQSTGGDAAAAGTGGAVQTSAMSALSILSLVGVMMMVV